MINIDNRPLIVQLNDILRNLKAWQKYADAQQEVKCQWNPSTKQGDQRAFNFMDTVLKLYRGIIATMYTPKNVEKTLNNLFSDPHSFSRLFPVRGQPGEVRKAVGEAIKTLEALIRSLGRS